MTSKVTIALQDNMLELVQTLGEPATVVPAAVRRYVVDHSMQRMEAAEERVRTYAQRYEMDYATFNRRVALDQAFLDRLNQEHPLRYTPRHRKASRSLAAKGSSPVLALLAHVQDHRQIHVTL